MIGDQAEIDQNRIDIDSNDVDIAALQSGKTDKVNPSTDDAIVRFDGITGDQQDSLVTIDDTGNIYTPGNVTVDGNVIINGTTTSVNSH